MCFDGVVPASSDLAFFLTRSKRCSAQHLAKYLLAGVFAGVTRCSDARAQHFWLWRSAKTDACSTLTPTSKNTCLSPFDGCCLKPNVANVVDALRQRPSATQNVGPEDFTRSVWTREKPPDCFVLCCWTALHSDPVLQHGAATGGEFAETRSVHHTVCCACVPGTRVNTQDSLQITRARSQEFTRTRVFAHRFPL